MQLKKCLFTLTVDGYDKAITDITFPLFQRYAHKIGADFRVISDRLSPDMPPVYEKLQIYNLGREYDWNIFFDADALVHPETIDFTTILNKDTVLHNANDTATIRWRFDEVFLRDGRQIGSCNWFAIASDWCLDLWHPLDIPYEQALDNIFPTPLEMAGGITREHLIDDYTLSRNIARFGLKFRRAVDIQREVGLVNSQFFYHQYAIPHDQKIVDMRRVVKEWGL
jgi:hypothetical protein